MLYPSAVDTAAKCSCFDEGLLEFTLRVHDMFHEHSRFDFLDGRRHVCVGSPSDGYSSSGHVLSYPVVFLQAHLSFLGGELWDTLCGDGPEMIYYDDDDDYYDDDDRICRTQNWDLWVCFVIALLAFGVCEQEMDLLISWAITVSQHSSALWRCCTMNRHCFRTVHKSFVH